MGAATDGRCCRLPGPRHHPQLPPSPAPPLPQSTKPDFSDYDENGAWPYILDDFVTWMKAGGDGGGGGGAAGSAG